MKIFTAALAALLFSAPVLAQEIAAPQPAASPADALNAAAATTPAAGYSQSMVKAQVLLARAGFSPGVIDGYNGGNMRHALAAFARAKSLKSATLNAAMWTALGAETAPPIAAAYTITAPDVAGPYTKAIPKVFTEQAKLPALGYTSIQEMLAERFHMDQALLTKLNPKADFSKAGTQIIVVQPGERALPAVATIRVNSKTQSISAYDAQNQLVAFYPATVGSKDYPTPAGTWAVNSVSTNPVYYYDPKRLTFGEGEAAGKLKLAAGPNNPVGSVWIDLTKDTYGIHGAPEPRLVGKVNSHGCVRLTNWDAGQLAKAVSKATKVIFDDAAA